MEPFRQTGYYKWTLGKNIIIIKKMHDMNAFESITITCVPVWQCFGKCIKQTQCFNTVSKTISLKMIIPIMITQPLFSFSCRLWTNWRCQNIQSERFMGLFSINSSWSFESEYTLAPALLLGITYSAILFQCGNQPSLTDLAVTTGRLRGAACHSTQSVAGTKCFFISSRVY